MALDPTPRLHDRQPPSRSNPDGASLIRGMRSASVAAGWKLIEAYEALGQVAAQSAFETALVVEERKAQGVAPLQSWPSLPDRSYTQYTTGPNRVRLGRLLDFLAPDDRILDVGVGFGYVTSAILRTGLPAYYCGIDLQQRYIEAAREGLRVNQLEDRALHLEVRDLHDIDHVWVEQHRPSLVLVLEVLEHVPDAGSALKQLASTVGQEATLLFTVPMLGRLESVWGHRSLFDASRIAELCTEAQLTVHHVEPVHNRWSLVLASGSCEVPQRLERLLTASTPRTRPRPRHYQFEPVDLSGLPNPHRGPSGHAIATVSPADPGLHCVIARSSSDLGSSAWGGISIPITGFDVLRLDLILDDLGEASNAYLDGYEGECRVARWRWRVARKPRSGQRITQVIRAFSAGDRFHPVGRLDADSIDRLDLSVELEPGGQKAEFTLKRAEYVRSPRVADSSA